MSVSATTLLLYWPLIRRLDFERRQLQDTTARLRTLRTTAEREESVISQNLTVKGNLETEVASLISAVEKHKSRLQSALQASREADEQVDKLRAAARAAQRTLDGAFKEISSWNDEIEKAAASRYAIYRRCRLDEIELPLRSGSFNTIPLEQVRLANRGLC